MMISIEAAALVSLIAYEIGVLVGTYNTYVSECSVMDGKK